MAILKGKVLGFNSVQSDGKIIKCYANRIQDATYQPLDLTQYMDKMVEVEGHLHGAVLSQAKFKRMVQLKAECRNCLYFRRLKQPNEQGKTGKCHLNPPQYYYDFRNNRMQCNFPLVNDAEWCSQFEPLKPDM